MIKNIVFDMGNVLMDFDARRYVASCGCNEADSRQIMVHLFRSVEWVQLDRGVLTDQEAIDRVCSRLPQRLHGTVRELMDRWSDDIPDLPGVEELVRRLKEAGYGIYLLSNASTRFYQYHQRMGAIQYFDGEFISADWHLLKPEIELYRVFCQHFGLIPGECFFVDDMPVNIEGARRAGMQGAVFHHDLELLTMDLEAAGVSLG